MNKFLILCVALLALAGCKKSKTPSVHPDWTYSSVMYEVNIRQFSPEGTFAGVEAQLPRLKELGVDILWLMPMYEIGTEGRKGTLGSYYAISDYKKVNPEFGTMADFEHLLAAAHKLGFDAGEGPLRGELADIHFVHHGAVGPVRMDGRGLRLLAAGERQQRDTEIQDFFHTCVLLIGLKVRKKTGDPAPAARISR